MNDLKKKVLVVDDHPKVLKFIEIDLRFCGFEVITTTSGEKALELIKSEYPDIILLDIIMPDIDGFEVLRQLRSFSNLPVIAFSASIDNYDEAMQVGASVFLSKPFAHNEVVNTINKLLGY